MISQNDDLRHAALRVVTAAEAAPHRGQPENYETLADACAAFGQTALDADTDYLSWLAACAADRCPADLELFDFEAVEVAA